MARVPTEYLMVKVEVFSAPLRVTNKMSMADSGAQKGDLELDDALEVIGVNVANADYLGTV